MDDRFARTMDELKTEGRWKMKEPMDDGRSPSAWKMEETANHWDKVSSREL
jgi:hypothetical protein